MRLSSPFGAATRGGPPPGRQADGSTWTLARFAFLRLLGVALVGTFLALWDQGLSLLGERGLSPIADTMAQCGRFLDPWSRWRLPTLFWLSTSDGYIRLLAGTGVAAAVLLTLGVWPRAMCALCYALFLSFAATDRIVAPLELRWFNWPSDQLLTEATFLAIFVAPAGLYPGLAHRCRLNTCVRWLLYWLTFRLFFGPGIAKLLSGSPEWRDLSALKVFHETQPSPAPAAAILFAAPSGVHAALALCTLAFEVVGAFLLLVPGRPRRIAALAGMAMVLMIHVCGNFRGLTWVSFGLLLLFLDDAWLLRRLPAHWLGGLRLPAAAAARPRAALRALAMAGAAVLGLSGAVSLANHVRLDLGRVGGVLAVIAPARALGLGDGYAMFAGIPPERPGLVLQGSSDGTTWLDYETRGAPANPHSVPRYLSPYCDYLGFALWAAGYQPPEQAPAWLLTLARRLLEGDAACRHLFAVAPFAAEAPRWVRVVRFSFRFATADERHAGMWWQRAQATVFLPARALAPHAQAVK